MTHRFNIKRFWLVVGLLLLVECAALWAYRSCSRTLPESQCSEVYRRYAHVPGVEAAFVKGFPINDTLGVDVTLLRATDSAGWDSLMMGFHIPEEVLYVARANPDFTIFTNLVLREHPEIQVALKGDLNVPKVTEDDVEYRVIDFQKKEICIFHTRNAIELSAVRSYNHNKMITN